MSKAFNYFVAQEMILFEPLTLLSLQTRQPFKTGLEIPFLTYYLNSIEPIFDKSSEKDLKSSLFYKAYDICNHLKTM